ncbi:MAG: STAS domain-containing protein [Candidatus Viridilinea halotolerans]|uniref:STAS domain-containing protein n=1 Tax=Candidatus Viridilinea halotolerans TaxID=2491704 RepID=A0A426TRU4_9CHLR|nr:MAG: STAS domain-containing protein [Candidatus Viridilinea halotolerans]
MSDSVGDAAAPDNAVHAAGLLALLPNPCALVAAEGHVLAVNGAWSELFGAHNGQGQPLVEAVAALFQWEHEAWLEVIAELEALRTGQVAQVRFAAALVVLPARWFAATLAPTAHGTIIWQLQEITQWRAAEAYATDMMLQMREAIESISEGLALYDEHNCLVFCNKRYHDIYPLVADLMTPGRSILEILYVGIERGQFTLSEGEDVETFVTRRMSHFRGDGDQVHRLDGERWVRAIDRPTRSGGVVGIRTDVTEQRKVDELTRTNLEQEAVLRAQGALLSELSTPLLRIGPTTLLMPLIGALDSQRARRVVEHLLSAIEAQRTALVILDITGVPIVDTQVANLLLQSARAVRLLGARMVLTGIRPDVAETIVTLGVDLSMLTIRGSLQDGVREALKR